MKINSFVLSKYHRDERFEYGIILVPNRTLDRLTDSMAISVEKKISGRNLFNICFKKKHNSKLVINKFILLEKDFKEYIDFLMKQGYELDEIKNNKKIEFIIGNQGKITISSLNKDIIKISSEKMERTSLSKVFFTLLRIELLQYTEALKEIYSGKEISNLLTYQMSYLTNPLTKKEKDKLYLDVLYIFIDCALDYRNKESFHVLSKEVQKILKD